MKRAIQIIVVLFILAGAAYGVWRWQGREDAPVSYRTATVERGDIAKRISASGTVNPLVNVQVGSQVSGIIQKIFVDFNASVKEGQLLAQLEPALFEAEVKQAEGDYLSAKANVALAKVVLDRTEDLFTKKIGPKSDRDDAQARYDSALGSLQRVEGSLQRAKADLEHTKIYSPVEGTVISRNVDVGQTVAASMSAPTLFVIAKDLTKMQIDINVGEGDIGQVREEQKVKFTVDAYPDDTFRGRVIQVRNQPLNVDNVVSYDVIVSVDNSELRLKPGMTANANVTVAEAKEVLQIPNSTFRFRPVDAEPEPKKSSKLKSKHRDKGGSQTTANVWIVGADNKPQKVSVELGLTDGEVSEIKSGLSEGQEVIVGYSGDAPKEKTAKSPFGSPSVGRMRPF